MGHTRHRVLAEKVVNLAFRKSLNLCMSASDLNGERRLITRYLLLLASVVAIVAYLFNNMAALIAGFKLAKSDVPL